MSHVRAGRSNTRRALALIAGTLVGLALAEIVLRAVLAARGKAFEARAFEAELERVVSTMNESMATQGHNKAPANAPARAPDAALVLHPYLAFDWSSMALQMNREREFCASAEREQCAIVLIVGGSVAAGFGGSGLREFEPLVARHPRFAGKSLRFFSHARGGYKQPQQLMDVAFSLSYGIEPDVVLNVDGFNECAIPSLNVVEGVNPLFPSTTHWAHMAAQPALDAGALDDLASIREAQRGAQATLAFARAWHAFDSALAAHLVAHRVAAQHRDYAAGYERYSAHATGKHGLAVIGPPPPADWVPAMELAFDNWQESSRSIAALCRERGIAYLHVLQPTLHDAGSKTLTPEELSSAGIDERWKRGIEHGYPRLRELGEELAREGVEFADGSQLFRDVPQRIYVDLCHYTDEGNALFARFVGAELAARRD